MQNPDKKNLCVDFDGVIHSYLSGWQGADNIPDEPVAGAMAALHEYCDHFNVFIYSARSGQEGGIEAMKLYINTYDQSFMASQHDAEAWFNRGLLVNKLHFPESKPPAILYIDDRGFRFEGIFPDVDVIKALSVTWNNRTTDELHAHTDIHYDSPPRNPKEWNFKPGGVDYVAGTKVKPVTEGGFKPLPPDPDKR